MSSFSQATTQSVTSGNSNLQRIGCQPVIMLIRKRNGNNCKPTSLSAVVLPGCGMNLILITAYLPGEIEISLLHSPSIEEATSILGGPGDPNGTKSFTMCGDFMDDAAASSF
jgi:hypothetical protein